MNWNNDAGVGGIRNFGINTACFALYNKHQMEVHLCYSNKTSTYLRESMYCNEKEVYLTLPDVFTCGREWYYSFEVEEKNGIGDNL